MAKRKRSAGVGRLLVADPHTLRRLVEAVERLHGLVGDLALMLAEPRRRAEAAAATRRAREAARLAEAAAALNGEDLAEAGRAPLEEPGGAEQRELVDPDTGLPY